MDMFAIRSLSQRSRAVGPRGQLKKSYRSSLSGVMLSEVKHLLLRTKQILRSPTPKRANAARFGGPQMLRELRMTLQKILPQPLKPHTWRVWTARLKRKLKPRPFQDLFMKHAAGQECLACFFAVTKTASGSGG